MPDETPGTVPVRRVFAVSHGLAAHRPDLFDDLVGRAACATFAVHRHPEVIDHHLGALTGELESMAPSQAPAGTGDDHNSPVTYSLHWLLLDQAVRSRTVRLSVVAQRG